MASWPATLPNPDMGDYQEDMGEHFIRTEMDTGPPKTRRRSTSRWINVTAGYTLTDAQMEAWRTWYEGDANFGAAEIGDWPRPPAGTTYPVIFRSAPVLSNQDWDRWKLSVELMVNLGG